jgi:autotransporter-associated beta strand protein
MHRPELSASPDFTLPHMYSRHKTSWLGACAASLLYWIPAVAVAQQDGYWGVGAGGSWANAANWDGGIAQGTDYTAFFGISLEPTIPANAVFTLDGAQTIGDIDFTGSSAFNWTFNTGSGGPLTLDNDFDYPGVTVALANQQVTINLVFAGDTGMEKLGDGTLVLNATNTYTGGAVVSAGTLTVNGAITDTNALTVTTGTLGGTGMISGPVTIQTGCLFAPGNPLGTLTISNSLALQAGSTTWINVKASTLAHDTVQGLSSISYGGTLIVSNLAGTPALGQNYPVFNAAGSSGEFSSLTPQLTGAIRWRFNPASGVLSVISTNQQPRFASAALFSRTNFVFSVTNGVPGFTNYVLVATNIATPFANWVPLATNVYDAGGTLTFTNPLSTGAGQKFFLISTKP